MGRYAVADAAVLMVLAFFGCRAGEESAPVRVSETRKVMGTYMVMTVYAPDEGSGRRAIAAAFDRVEEVEAALSDYREQSDVSRVNRAAGGPAIEVSRDLCQVLRRSAEVSAESDGAFDVTCGPLIVLWRTAWRTHRLPTDGEVAAARARVDYRAVELGASGTRVRLLRVGMRLDLGGIGKGYAVDQAIAVLRRLGIRAALIAAAGDIYALGAPPGREGWLIGIRDPSQPRGEIGDPLDLPTLARPLLLRGRAVSTSGDYEQFGVISGRRYSHIVDPRTGRPVEGMTSVTVVAPDSTMADAYATAFSVLGAEATLAFAARRPGIEVMILHEREGKREVLRSPGFEKLETNP